MWLWQLTDGRGASLFTYQRESTHQPVVTTLFEGGSNERGERTKRAGGGGGNRSPKNRRNTLSLFRPRIRLCKLMSRGIKVSARGFTRDFIRLRKQKSAGAVLFLLPASRYEAHRADSLARFAYATEKLQHLLGFFYDSTSFRKCIERISMRGVFFYVFHVNLHIDIDSCVYHNWGIWLVIFDCFI